MNQFDCNTPRPRTRSEAWSAWESSLLFNAEKKVMVRSHLKTWEKVFRGPGRWYLYAKATRPNRMEVLVETFVGVEVWVKISQGMYKKAVPWQAYLINGEVSPEMAQNQRQCLKDGNLSWHRICGISDEEFAAVREERRLLNFIERNPPFSEVFFSAGGVSSSRRIHFIPEGTSFEDYLDSDQFYWNRIGQSHKDVARAVFGVNV